MAGLFLLQMKCCRLQSLWELSAMKLRKKEEFSKVSESTLLTIRYIPTSCFISCFLTISNTDSSNSVLYL